jgi:multiple sugar transport system substrate-binding protein
MLVFVTACSDKGGPRREPAIEGKFLVIWDAGSGLSFQHHLEGPIKARHPGVELRDLQMERKEWKDDSVGPNPPLTMYRAAEWETEADLIMFESVLAPFLFKSGYLEPLDRFVQSDAELYANLDGRALDYARAQGYGTLYGIPFGKNVYALYYNKTLFDELGMPHPVNGMTWDEVFGLAERIAVHEGLGERAAFRFPDENLAISQLGIPVFDPATGEIDADNPERERVRLFVERVYEVESLTPLGRNFTLLFSHFAAGRIAMIPGRFIGDNTSWAKDHTTWALMPYKDEWGFVSFPVHADRPRTGPAPAYYYLGIPKTSMRKEEAYRLIRTMLEEEAQRENSRRAVASVWRDPAVNDRFGELDSSLSGRDTSPFFHHPEQGMLDPEYDLDMQYIGTDTYWPGGSPTFLDLMEYRRQQLEKVGVSFDEWPGRAKADRWPALESEDGD